MRSSIRFAPVLLLAGVLAGASVASAQPAETIMDFGAGCATEGTRAPDDHTSTAGDTLCIVGHVVFFDTPFDDLDPNDPNKEYTYVYDGLISQGTVTTPINPGIGWWQYDTDYTGGTLKVYCDPAQNATLGDKSSYEDGECILEMSLANFHIMTNTIGTPCNGNQNADITFTGGTRVGDMAGCTGGIATGQFSACSQTTIPGCGGFGNSDTKIDPECPTPAIEKSWGGVKIEFNDDK